MERQSAQSGHSVADPRPGARRADDLTASNWAPLPAPPSWHSRPKSGVAWEVTSALLILALIVTVVSALFMVEMWLADRILPGVRVWNVDLGSLTYEQAVERLTAELHYPANRHPTLRYGDQVWSLTPEDLGVQIDVAATANEAMRLGHGGDLAARLVEQVDIIRNGQEITPSFAVDPAGGAMLLRRVAHQVNRPSRNAVLVLQDDLSAEISPSQVGIEVDEEATRQALVRRILAMKGGQEELVIRTSKPLLTDLSAAQAEVQQILKGPVTLTAPDFEPAIVEPSSLAEWLILRPVVDVDDRPTLDVSLDLGPAARLAEEIAAQIARDPIDAEFRFDVTSETIIPLVESVPGRRLDITGTITLIEKAATSDQRTVPLPLIPIPPAVATEDIPNVDAFELIGQGKTKFTGSSAARIQNIVVGTTQFDGLLIAPDETFSFNHYLGEVTTEKGYAESIIIWGNETRADVGGGLCQVSSTAFRAAFWAGLPITERWPHTFRVSYYEPPLGMDATIYSPRVDLKWINDTGEHILIRTNVDKGDKTVTFDFYGISPGRTVEMDGPYESRPVAHGPAVYRDDPTLPKGQTQQIEWAKDGLDVTVYRIVKENGEQVRRDKFFSRYRPWQAVYRVGTKEE